MATAHRTFVSYIDRTREFYRAQGYERPYAWAHFEDVPFAELSRPLAECRLTLVTTASPWHEEGHDPGSLRGAKQVWSGPTAEQGWGPRQQDRSCEQELCALKYMKTC